MTQKTTKGCELAKFHPHTHTRWHPSVCQRHSPDNEEQLQPLAMPFICCYLIMRPSVHGSVHTKEILLHGKAGGGASAHRMQALSSTWLLADKQQHNEKWRTQTLRLKIHTPLAAGSVLSLTTNQTKGVQVKEKQRLTLWATLSFHHCFTSAGAGRWESQ